MANDKAIYVAVLIPLVFVGLGGSLYGSGITAQAVITLITSASSVFWGTGPGCGSTCPTLTIVWNPTTIISTLLAVAAFIALIAVVVVKR